MTYGGASASPEDPSPDSVKLAESLVITTFIGDIFPESKVVPADPAQRALAMLFAITFETSVIDAWRNFFFEGAPSVNLLKALEAVQARLPGEGKGSFAIGEWSFADIAAAPVLVRIVLMLENGYGPAAEREKVLETLRGPKFARLLRYIEDIRARPSFQKAFNVVSCVSVNGLIYRSRVSTSRRRTWRTGSGTALTSLSENVIGYKWECVQ